MNGSASPNAAIGPVRGLTCPILITRDCALTGMTLRMAGAARAPRPALMTLRRSILSLSVFAVVMCCPYTIGGCCYCLPAQVEQQCAVYREPYHVRIIESN